MLQFANVTWTLYSKLHYGLNLLFGRAFRLLFGLPTLIRTLELTYYLLYLNLVDLELKQYD